jgi:hypothetical protein
MLDKCKLVLTITYGPTAFIDQIVLIGKGDFGPWKATARYVGDKAFESFSIIFSIRIWQFPVNIGKLE